jgi:4-aminobutyrate aminotransferase-like enzyme
MPPSPEPLSWMDAPRIVAPPPGPRSRDALAQQAKLETEAVGYPRYFPIAPARARGSTLEDLDGNRFVDWVAGICVLNLGHRHPRVERAVAGQLERIWHALELPTEARLEFLGALADRLPGGLRGRSRVFFTVTGGDAVETAVSIADHVKGRHGTIVFSGAYHGVHGGAVNLTSGRRYHRTSAFRGGQIVRVPYPDPSRPLLDRAGSSQGLMRYLEHLAGDPHSGVDELSSVLVEPILGEGGYVLPPEDFLPSLREFCDRHDLLLIADEIQTGLGRTGSRWAVEHYGVTPDLICIAKSIGGGIPLSMVAYRADLGELPRGFHLGTFRANPLALAAGVEVLRELDEGGWIERVRHRGPSLLEGFRAATAGDPTVGEVRGRGFMIGVEFVRPGTERTPFGERAAEVRRELLARGVLMHTCGSHDHVLRFMAPLTIEEPLLERGLAALAEATAQPVAAPPPGRGPHPRGSGGRLGPATDHFPVPEPIRPGFPL